MVDGMLLEFCRRPGKHKEVVTFAGRHFPQSFCVNFFNRNTIDNYIGVIFLAPWLGPFCFKPGVVFRDKMIPFGDLECLGIAQRTLREIEEGPDRSSSDCELNEIAARKGSLHPRTGWGIGILP